MDVGNAYLEADMVGEEVLIELDSWVVQILKNSLPIYSLSLMREDGWSRN